MNNKILALALSVPFFLAGCNSSDGGGGGGSSSKSPTFEITAENRSMIDAYALSTVGGSFEMIGFIGEFGDFDDYDEFSMPSRVLGSEFDSRAIASRASGEESYDCDQGSASISFSTTGISDEGEFSSSGSISATMTANNCRTVWWDDEYDVENGTFEFSISWSGFDDVTETFGSLSMSVTAKNFSYKEFESDGTLISSEETDGTIEINLSGDNFSMSFNMIVGGSALDGKAVRIASSEDITGSMDDDYPTGGKWRVTGSNNSRVDYTVVSNGVEVSLNGGQAELVTWQEIEEMDDF